MCNRLCYNDDWHIQSAHSASKIVIMLTVNEIRLVLKSSRPSIDDFDTAYIGNTTQVYHIVN